MWSIGGLIPELKTAIMTGRSYFKLHLYRSRTELTKNMITDAFSWLNLRNVDFLKRYAATDKPNYLALQTIAIPRGTPTEEVYATIKYNMSNLVSTYRNDNWLDILVVNTTNSKTTAEEIYKKIEESGEYKEVNCRTMTTLSAAHVSRLYLKTTNTNNIVYLAFTNTYTEEYFCKLGAAILHELINTLPVPRLTPELEMAYLSHNVDTLNDLLKPYYKDIAEIKRMAELTDSINSLSNKIYTQQKARMENELVQRKNTAENVYSQYLQALQNLETSRKKLITVQQDEINDTKLNDLKDFLLSCKDKVLTYKGNNGSIIVVKYRAPLLFWDEKMYGILRGNSNTARHNAINDQDEITLKLLDAIFKDKTAQVIIESSASLNLMRFTVSYQNMVTDNDLGLPNPHHYYYNCWGNNAAPISKALQERNYLNATAQLFSAMVSLNMSDSSVISKFVNEMLRDWSYCPCIKFKDDDKCYTIPEAKKILNEKGQKNNETDQTN